MDSIYGAPLVAKPGETTIDSDLGMMTMGKVVEQVTGGVRTSMCARSSTSPWGCRVRRSSLRMRSLRGLFRRRRFPLARRVVRGEVHDENAALLGGVSGHVGLFSTATDLVVFVQMLSNDGVDAGRRSLFFGDDRRFVGTRPWIVVSWDGNSVPGRFFLGTLFSESSSGTRASPGIGVDRPERWLFVVLLTNRVHPTRANRRIYVCLAVHDAVIRSLIR